MRMNGEGLSDPAVATSSLNRVGHGTRSGPVPAARRSRRDPSSRRVGAALCPDCGLSHHDLAARKERAERLGESSPGSERKTWHHNEAARAASTGVPLAELVGPAPAEVSWSLFAGKEAQTNTRSRGSIKSMADWLWRVSCTQTTLDKAESPVFSGATSTGRSGDRFAEATYSIYFDCDEAGTWDELKRRCQEAGVSAIFQESASRRPDRWHVVFPLARPFVFAPDDNQQRKDFKHAYRHMAAVLSAVAGFQGVGGHCGFDLATDRILHPMFVPTCSEAGQQPARLEVVEGPYALDFEALLLQTGFDLEASQAAYNSGGLNGKRTRRTGGGVSSAYSPATPISRDEWGPLGKALVIDGMIGRQKDENGFHAACTHPELHSSGKAEGYAIYFPSTDTLWCSSTGCSAAQVHRDRAGQLARLSPLARKSYKEATDAKFEGERRNRYAAPFRWEELTPSTAYERLSTWVEKQGDLFPVTKVTQALLGALLAAGWEPSMARKVAHAMLGKEDGDREALGVLEAFRRRRGRVPQQRRLRELLSPRQLQAVSEAVFGFSRQGEEKVKKWWRRGVLTDAKAEWLLALGDTIPIHEPDLKNTLIRPAGCCRYGDDVIADGEKTGTRILVCESPGCGQCWVRRVEIEAKIIAGAWKEDQEYGIIRVTLPDEDALDRFERICTKRISHSPRLKFHGRSETGCPTITFVGTHNDLWQTRGAVLGDCQPRNLHRIAPGKEDQVKVEINFERPKADAVAAVVDARLSIHFAHSDFIHAQDREGLIGWAEWLRPRREGPKRGSRQLVTKSQQSLPFPSREKVREFCRGDEEAVDLSECWSVRFELRDMKHRWLLDVSDQRHSLPKAMELARHNREFKAVKRALEEPRDREQERIDTEFLLARKSERAYALRV